MAEINQEELQAQINLMNERYGQYPQGIPFYLMAKGGDDAYTAFDNHFNSRLPIQSTYFAALKKMMSCVETNSEAVGAAREQVCAKEFKALRLAAFKDELLYHNINKASFIQEITYAKENKSAF